MATTTPPDDAEQPERPFWSLLRDDQRLVFATFLGGLAANIGLVLVLALGLLVVHLIHRYEHALAFTIGITAIQVIATTLATPFAMQRSDRAHEDAQAAKDEAEMRVMLLRQMSEEEIERVLLEWRAERELSAKRAEGKSKRRQRVTLAFMVPVSAILILALIGYAAGLK